MTSYLITRDMQKAINEFVDTDLIRDGDVGKTIFSGVDNDQEIGISRESNHLGHNARVFIQGDGQIDLYTYHSPGEGLDRSWLIRDSRMIRDSRLIRDYSESRHQISTIDPLKSQILMGALFGFAAEGITQPTPDQIVAADELKSAMRLGEMKQGETPTQTEGGTSYRRNDFGYFDIHDTINLPAIDDREGFDSLGGMTGFDFGNSFTSGYEAGASLRGGNTLTQTPEEISMRIGAVTFGIGVGYPKTSNYTHGYETVVPYNGALGREDDADSIGTLGTGNTQIIEEVSELLPQPGVSFTHTVASGETLSGIVFAELQRLGVDLNRYSAGELAKDAAPAAGLPVEGIATWAKDNGTTADAVCNAMRSDGFKGDCDDVTFIEIQPGQTIKGRYVEETGQLVLTVTNPGEASSSRASGTGTPYQGILTGISLGSSLGYSGDYDYNAEPTISFSITIDLTALVKSMTEKKRKGAEEE